MNPYEEALPEVPVRGWEMVQSGFYDDGAVYYFEDNYWEMRVDCVSEQILFKRKNRQNGVAVTAGEPIVLRAYGIMLNIKSCHSEGMERSV